MYTELNLKAGAGCGEENPNSNDHPVHSTAESCAGKLALCAVLRVLCFVMEAKCAGQSHLAWEGSMKYLGLAHEEHLEKLSEILPGVQVWALPSFLRWQSEGLFLSLVAAPYSNKHLQRTCLKSTNRLDPCSHISGFCSCLSSLECPEWQVWSWVAFLWCWWRSTTVQQTFKDKLKQRKHKKPNS